MEVTSTPLEVDYAAVFNPDNGSILSIGPKDLFSNEQNKISINSDIVERINKGELRIQSCFLDISTGSLEIAETKNLFKIDDVLHRIPNYTDIQEQPDIYVKYCSINKMFTISLHRKWGGFYGELNNGQKPTRVVWAGDTALDFLITKRNDPNIIFNKFSCCIDNLIDNNIEFKLNLDNCKFSMYTKRVMKNYVLEMTDENT